MSVTFFGLAGGDAPTINLDKNFDVAGSHAFIKFQNVKLEENGAGYFINQSKACTISEFTLEDCEVSNMKTIASTVLYSDIPRLAISKHHSSVSREVMLSLSANLP